MTVAVLGLDLAKHVFQLHGVDEHGRAVVSRRVSRAKLAETVAQLAPQAVAMAAAADLPEVRAVVTIAAPADTEHVIAGFRTHVPVIEREGEAEVELAGRRFTIRRQFLDDVRGQDLEHFAGQLGRAYPQWWKHPAASCGVTASRAGPSAWCSASAVRAARRRSSAFTLAQIGSIGLRSGE